MMRKFRSPNFQFVGYRSAAVALFLLFIFSAFPLDLSTPSAAHDRVTTATREGRLIVFDEAWQTIRERYYDPKLHGLDWQELRARLRPLAAEAASETEFYSVLRRLTSRLRDAHTRVFSPDERFDWQRPTYISVGVSLREIAGEIIVTAVERGGEAERGGVRAGDALLSIEGEPVAAVFARRLTEEVGASTDVAARQQAAARLFKGARDTFVNAVFTRDNARAGTRSVRLRRVLQNRPPALSVHKSEGFHVVNFNMFVPEIASELMRALRRGELRGARGLVIDLRDNGGGHAETMTDIASAFLPQGTNLGEFTDRDGRVSSAPQTRAAMLFAADAVAEFRGAVVVLTSTRTASAAEILAAALQETRRARVIGENTCGCVLAIRRRHTLPDGGLLDISEMDFRTARHTRLEGQGITPDELVSPTRRDISDGRDPALERALKILREKGEGKG
ncbi:MAG TPA: S41 family peptidase [Pyrinomonadaceae bacterium]|jgi:carboxyl-terminal processing protease|nr:S41 family peptidase [Pyrinomonadaceae bacterium]